MLSFGFAGDNLSREVAAVEKRFGVSKFCLDLESCWLLSVPYVALYLTEDHGEIQASMAVVKMCGMPG